MKVIGNDSADMKAILTRCSAVVVFEDFYFLLEVHHNLRWLQLCINQIVPKQKLSLEQSCFIQT